MARHLVLKTKDKHFLLSSNSAQIVKALQKAGAKGMTYDQLETKTHAERRSLYVFAQRLRNANIVKMVKDGHNQVKLLLADEGLIISTATRLI